jgi:uncharacterized protein YndB with AHSA1/START domain
MERKTKVTAEEGKHDVVITRDFELPVELLYKAYVEPEIVEQWMGTKVLKMEAKKFGSWQNETKDQNGNVVFAASGVIHDLIQDKKIIRTFEMGNTPFGVQLEVYEFEKLTDNTSRLNMHVIYETIAQRDQVMKLPFTSGINWAHNRLEEVVAKMKQSV